MILNYLLFVGVSLEEEVNDRVGVAKLVARLVPLATTKANSFASLFVYVQMLQKLYASCSKLIIVLYSEIPVPHLIHLQ